jgi:G patch domain and KOW motifs-containing protein
MEISPLNIHTGIADVNMEGETGDDNTSSSATTTADSVTATATATTASCALTTNTANGTVNHNAPTIPAPVRMTGFSMASSSAAKRRGRAKAARVAASASGLSSVMQVGPVAGSSDSSGNRAVITSLNANTLASLAAPKKKKDVVIPLIGANQWSNNASDSADSTSAASASNAPPTSPTPHTESIEQQAINALLHPEEANKEEQVEAIPLLVQNKVPGIDTIEDETERFRHDVSMRPSESSLDDYERVTVDDFGKAMLRGMGWKEGAAIGGSTKVLVEPIEFIPRGKRMGLGAVESKLAPMKPKKYIKPGETREVKQTMRVAPDADGNVRHYRKMSDRLIPVSSRKLRVGALVEFIAGPHRKLYGRVTSMNDTSSLRVRLNLNETEVSTIKVDINVLDENALPKDHPALSVGRKASSKAMAASANERNTDALMSDAKALQDALNGKVSRKRKAATDVDISMTPASKQRRQTRSLSRSDSASSRSRSSSLSSLSSRSQSPTSSHHRAISKHQKKHKHKHSKSKSKKSKSKKSKKSKHKSKHKSKKEPRRITWVRPSIRVRIVNKRLEGGKYYARKAVVMDVVNPYEFTAMADDDGRILDGLTEADVETALPKPGGRAVVVYGPHKGAKGSLLERSSSKNRVVLQLDEDLSVVTLTLDDVTEVIANK